METSRGHLHRSLLSIPAAFGVVLGLIAFAAVPATANAYDIGPTISRQIAANPIKIAYWVKPGVTPENEARVMAEIAQGLRLWEDVPTACISFTTARVIHSATEPTFASDELPITIGNFGDITNGGANLPLNGNPGRWYGVLADRPQVNTPLVAAHEVGHAIGFHHSTISLHYPSADHPVMHFSASRPQLSLAQDDVAAVSGAYPCESAPFYAVTGSVYGTLKVKNGTALVSGVNVVAIDTATGRPVVARLTGHYEQASGSFYMGGLPPGTYRLDFLDGHSYHGYRPVVEWPADGDTVGLRGGFQVDNFAAFSSAPFTITGYQWRNLGETQIEIFDMSFDSITDPEGTVGAAYDLKMHIRGGLRDIRGTATGLPPGLTGVITAYPPGSTEYVFGNHFFRISGTPTQAGVYTVNITLTDRAGKVKVIPQTIVIRAPGLVARYKLEGNGTDSSGNGHHATVVGGTWVADRFGVAGRALSMGDNSEVVLPHESAFDLAELTVVMVMKLPPVEIGIDDWFITKGITNSGAFNLRRYSFFGGLGSYGYDSPQGEKLAFLSNDPLPINRSVCVAAAMNSQSVKGYIDGQFHRETFNSSSIILNNEPVRIGGYADSTNSYMVGVVDEVQIYNTKLTQAGIQAACH